MVKVSVVVPVYNVEKYIKQCIESLLNQTLKDIEIICVDDGSTDNSLHILNELTQKDSRIKIFTQQNKGAGAARNLGISKANGEYLYFLDSDDFTDINLLKEAYEKIKANNAQICIFKNNEYDTQNNEFKPCKWCRKSNFKNIFKLTDYSTNFFSLFNVPAFTKLYSSKFIKENNIFFQEIKTCNDVFFNFYTLSTAERITFLNKTLVSYRTNQSSNLSANRNKYIENVKNAFSHLEECLKEKNLFEVAKKTYYRKASESFGYEIRQLKTIKEQKQWIDKLLKNIPFQYWSLKTIRLVFKTNLKHHLRVQHNYKNEKITSFIKILGFEIKVKEIKTSNENCLKHWYKEKTGKNLNLNNPQTFNEKIQWLKLYDSTPIKSKLSDKYLVKDFIKEQIGEEYIIKTLGVWNKFDEINFDLLPNQFVLKCNHGSGYNIIVKDKTKLNQKTAKRKITKWLKEDFAYKCGYEMHYSNIERKIIAEEYLSEIENNLFDYRFFCINGKVKQIWLDIKSGTKEHQRKIYNRAWEELNIVVTWPKLEDNIPKPTNLDKMIELSEKLSKDFSLVRVDFYNINNKIYFGEMTFTSMSGIGKFEPEIEDYNLGKEIVCLKN